MPVEPARLHPDTKTDRQLLDEARGGRGESFEVVYRRHHAVVLAFLGRHAQQPELAADLMAERAIWRPIPLSSFGSARLTRLFNDPELVAKLDIRGITA